MLDIKEITGLITEMNKEKNTPSGNPVWSITIQPVGMIQTFTFKTKPNVGWVHALTGHEIGNQVTITISGEKQPRISDMTHAYLKK